MAPNLRNTTFLSNMIGLLSGGAAAAAVIWFIVRHSTGLGATNITAATGMIAMISVVVGLTTSRATGVAVFAAGATLLINDAFLAANFASVLGFGHLALTDAVGLWAASSLLVIAIACGYQAAMVQSRRRWLLVAFVIAMAASFPTKLSSHFFV
jgi:hypothetical protein